MFVYSELRTTPGGGCIDRGVCSVLVVCCAYVCGAYFPLLLSH